MLLDSRFLTLPSYSYRSSHTHWTVDFDAGIVRCCQEILFEIGFIEELRTTCGNEEVAQIFFHNSEFLLFAKIRFNPFD